MPKEKASQLNFAGFQSPNFTSVPDDVFDMLLPHLSGSELKVLLYIIRRTYGFKKSSDSISLSQMLQGITTREGTVLDRGAGVGKQALLRALRSLQEKNIIRSVRRRSEDKGNEPTIYSLVMASETLGMKMIPPLVSKSDQGVVPESDQGVGTGITPGPRAENQSTQETVIQETELQNIGVVKALQRFGISPHVAGELAGRYSATYIMEKIEQVLWLIEQESSQGTRNPAGYLRKAIEENYEPPHGFKSAEERMREVEQQKQIIQDQKDRKEKIEEEQRRIRERVGELASEHYPPQAIPDTELTTETAWDRVLQIIQDRSLVARPAFRTWLEDTRLLWTEGDRGYVGVPNSYTAEQLEQNFYGLIATTLSEVVGQDMEVEFEALTDEKPE